MDFGVSPFLPPKLALRVGVTGHRPNRLNGVNIEVLERSINLALTCLKQVTQSVQAEADASGSEAYYTPDVEPDLRFLTALAAGSDTFSASVASKAGYKLNYVLPAPRAKYVEWQGFSSEEKADFDRLWNAKKGVGARMELDLGPAIAAEAAYASVGRLILAHSDVVIAVWDGEPGRGAGGTAEVVAEAQRKGHIVIWVQLDGQMRLWSRASGQEQRYEQWQWEDLKINKDADETCGGLGRAVRSYLTLPTPEPTRRNTHENEERTPDKCISDFRNERSRTRSWALGYILLQRLFLGRWREGFRPDYRGSVTFAAPQWDALHQSATDIGGDAYANHLSSSIQTRWEFADNLANHYGSLFRSTNVLNFLLAALAVLLGLAILIVEPKVTDPALVLGAKAALVIAELICIFSIILLTKRGRKGKWQQKWLDYRSLAEAFRSVRTPFLMGSTPLRHSDLGGMTYGEAWVIWYLRASTREIPPPSGVIDATALRLTINFLVQEEIKPQISYHKDNNDRLRKLEHRLERTSLVLLGLTMLTGLVYLLAYGNFLVAKDKSLIKDVVKPVSTFAGGVLPVFGAALFGIRVTGEFRSAARQSERMLEDLEDLESQFLTLRDHPNRVELRRLIALTTRTLSDDLRLWGMVFGDRGLEFGF
ncbi:DUF4231 domain-containing protein [uncultured Ruegeria sp.]|uniref:DUF4231 domain-containing protein n=1 Tax=uncultured Ruegeria sp. TaxID=259304 RepID=UPI00261C36E9|nr:DUF4231 domain-containing protein [uncultured Ruegeria sp.]